MGKSIRTADENGDNDVKERCRNVKRPARREPIIKRLVDGRTTRLDQHDLGFYALVTRPHPRP